MRFLFAALLVIPLVACGPARIPPGPPVPPPSPPMAKIVPRVPTQIASRLDSPRLSSLEIAGIAFEGVAFDSRSHRLRVVDQPGGPGSSFADAEAAGRGGLAAVNAGFFTPEGEPLGRVVSSGTSAGQWNSASSLGNAVWYESPEGITAIGRRENLGSARSRNMTELIQAGPLLVENGKSVGGLESTKSSIRTLLLWDGGSRWWVGRSSACTLAALGRALENGGPAGWPVRQALNLDGGRSSDLWVSAGVPGGPLSRRLPWNRPVRNFLVLVPSNP